jgi:hypothetical protein
LYAGNVVADGTLNNPSDGLSSACRPFIAPEICALSSFSTIMARLMSTSLQTAARRSFFSERPDGRPSLVWARGLDRVSLRRAMLETLARRGKLLAAWRRVHGPGKEGPQKG